MTAAVYIVGGKNRTREELRYSLRSVAVNAPDVTQVWIVGDVPDWVKGVRRLEVAQGARKFADQRAKMEAFCATKGAPRKFYLMNEDHYIHQYVEGPLPTFHMGDGRDYLAKVWRSSNSWCRAVKASLDYAQPRVETTLFGYVAHVPLLFDRHVLGEVLADIPAGVEVALDALYPVAGVGGVGVDAGNAKVKAGDDVEKKLAQGMPYTSGNAETFAGAHGDHIRGLFPDPCKWEK